MSFFNRMQKGNLEKPKSKQSKQVQQIYTDLEKNVEVIKHAMGEKSDTIYRSIRFGKNRDLQGTIIYMDGIVDRKSIQQNILEPLLLHIKGTELEELLAFDSNPLLLLKESVLTIGDIKVESNFHQLYQQLLSGYVIFLLENSDVCLVIGLTEAKERGVTEPTTQTVVRGPKEGFSETLGTNIALIRRKIKDSRLKLEYFSAGEVTNTSIAIMYIQGLADDKLVEEVHIRLSEVDMESVLESGMLEEAIQDKEFSPFPTIYNSERPDNIAAGLLEGRVAILVDGTPFVLIVPAIFVQFLQSPEDYYQRSDISSIIRVIRYISLFISLYIPAIYIAITTFHQEMIPYPLLLSLAAQQEGVPLPTFAECSLMLLLFEILREAGVRMPRVVGQAVSIVGAVVIGQAAVEAGIVSAAVVIVVSCTAISSFVLPANNLEIAVRILRFFMILIASIFGMIGVMIGSIALCLHLCSMRSFGVPYMSPIAPFVWSGQKDSFIRLPLISTKKGKKK